MKPEVFDTVRNSMIEKLIQILQTPERDAPQLSEEKLLKAIKIGTLIERHINDSQKTDKLRADKFKSMMSVLTFHAHMRAKLLSEEVSPSDIIKMKRDDFLSTTLKR